MPLSIMEAHSETQLLTPPQAMHHQPQMILVPMSHLLVHQLTPQLTQDQFSTFLNQLQSKW